MVASKKQIFKRQIFFLVMSEIISLKDVWKIYKEGKENQVIALKNINVSIKKGDFVAIMGPSGSGKSTAMNLIGSLDVPSRGKVFLDKHNIFHLSESDLAQVRGKKIGFIFQQFNLIPNLTAKENIILPMIFQGKEDWEREEKAEELLKMVELENRMDHYPSELSGGQQQRVAIARSLANDPEVILADEPTGNLDTKTGDLVMNFLTKLNNEGKTIIIVTHEPELAMKHAKIIYWIKDGQIEKVTKKEKGKWKNTRK
jgi:putative ABC transport system ATP-binding protein